MLKLHTSSRQKLTLLIAGLILVFTAFTAPAAAQTKQEDNMSLNDAQKGIVAIAALTASGDLINLKTALNEGLDAGLTVNEIKEVLVQMYPYAGFPRSLNGISTFMTVMDERGAQGKNDVIGPEATPMPADLDRDAYGLNVMLAINGLTEEGPPAG